MIKITKYIIAVAAAGLVSVQAHAGTISYVAVPSTNSDTSAGISPDNVYTSAIDGGNTTGNDRVVNGVTLSALSGTSNTSTANGITVNALSGSLSNSAGGAGSIAADGALAGAMQDMTSNDGAADGSQQEVVLDPATLTAGKTYDLRVYICNPAGQNRQVDLTFACDGQAPVETGFFNEDDATTSGGAFADKNQVYYINYRFTWDGATTPGITITQKSGAMPFLLYALTNQEVNTAGAAAPAPQPDAVDQEPVGSGPGQDVGVESDQFYDNDGLNRHGRWVVVGRYGRCWQPEGVAEDWAPYTRGHWVHSNYGWTWVSDQDEDDWGWAAYHYGRWSRVEDAGWVWVPGRVWAPAWVSWRDNNSCVGWAPLPPEADCADGVGISVWADNSYGLGPGAYNFVSVQNFGAPDMAAVLFARQRNAEFIQNTTNVTNIVNHHTVIYNGGPNVNTINAAIIKGGGHPIQSGLVLNRRGSARPLDGGKFSQLQGNVLTLAGPRVNPAKNLAGLKPAAATFKTPKFDKGWNQVGDPKAAMALKKKIALDAKGKTPKTSKAALPAGITLAPANAAAASGPAPAGLHPGKGFKKGATAGTTPGVPAGPLHPGQKFQQAAPGAPGVAAGAARHPGQPVKPAAGTGAQPAATPTHGIHPGQALTPAVAGAALQPAATPPGKKHGRNVVVPTATPPQAATVPHPGQTLPVPATTNAAQPTPTPAGRKHGKQNLAPATPAATPTAAVVHPGQALPVPATTNAAQPTPTPAGRKHGRQNITPSAPAAPVVPNAAPNAPQATPTPRHPGAQNPPGAAAASAQQQAAAANAAKQQQQAAAANAAKQQQQAAAANAAKQQQQAAAANAAKQQQQAAAANAARQQQQAATANAAKQQQQAAAANAASAQQQSAAANAARQQQQQAAAAANAARQQQQAAAANAARQQQQAAAVNAARQQQGAAAAAAQKQAAAAAAAKGGKPGPTPTP